MQSPNLIDGTPYTGVSSPKGTSPVPAKFNERSPMRTPPKVRLNFSCSFQSCF